MQTRDLIPKLLRLLARGSRIVGSRIGARNGNGSGSEANKSGDESDEEDDDDDDGMKNNTNGMQSFVSFLFRRFGSIALLKMSFNFLETLFLLDGIEMNSLCFSGRADADALLMYATWALANLALHDDCRTMLQQQDVLGKAKKVRAFSVKLNRMIHS